MIIIYSKQITERLSYTLDLIFNSVLEVGFESTDDKDTFLRSPLPKINYSDEDIDEGLFLNPHPLLFETTIAAQNTRSFTYEKQWCFFPSRANSFIPFDVFACSFYLASRYEEYLFTGKTEHNRFPAKESIQYKNEVLDEPLVNQWAQLLAQKISEKYPDFLVPEKKFHFLMTIDVDNAWAYLNKSFPIQTGGLLRYFLNRNFTGSKTRLNVLLGKEADPYDTFDFIEKTFEGIEDHLKFFFLLGNRGTYDKNISHKNRELRLLISQLAGKSEIGIHPSYESNNKKELVGTEKNRMETIIGKPVKNSRQHFLMLNLPDTYENLIKSGIENDYTMGYADAIGFRAGICSPFRFFNLEKNISTGLTVFPLITMDVTLKDYLKLSPEQAFVETEKLMKKVKATGGTFVVLWHNESVNDLGIWKNWREVFLKTIQTGISLENE